MNCQRELLPEINFILELMNQGIETGLLLSEIIKSNKDQEYIRSFIKFIISKITQEGNFKSSLIKQLVWLATPQ